MKSRKSRAGFSVHCKQIHRLGIERKKPQKRKLGPQKDSLVRPAVEPSPLPQGTRCLWNVNFSALLFHDELNIPRGSAPPRVSIVHGLTPVPRGRLPARRGRG